MTCISKYETSHWKGYVDSVLLSSVREVLCWGRRLLKSHSWGQGVLDIPTLGQEVCGFLHLRTRGTWVLFLHKVVREVLFCDWKGALNSVLWLRVRDVLFVTTCNSLICKLHIPEVISLKILFLCMNALGLSSCQQYILIKMTILFHFEFIKLLTFGNL